MTKRQHQGAIRAARQKHLRYKLEKGLITQEEYKIASDGNKRNKRKWSIKAGK